MPLINLKSDLTSCKYGHDRPGGSDSGQPFIISYSSGDIEVNTSARNPLALVGVSSIPAVPNFTTLLGRKKIGQFILDAVNGDDFIRGGGIGSLQASINDVFRISAFLASLPKGPIFLAKQVGLQLSNPILETRKGPTLLTGIGGFIGRITGGVLQPTRIYNLGINTLAQVGTNAFGGHFIRHGLSPIQSNSDRNSSYEKIVTFNNELGDYDNTNFKNIGNRLASLKKKFRAGYTNSSRISAFLPAPILFFIKPPNTSNSDQFTLSNTQARSKALDTVLIKGKINPFQDNYIKIDLIGGPGSVYGIGPTIIRKYYDSNDTIKIKESFAQSKNLSGKSRNNKEEPVSFQDSDFSLYKDLSLSPYRNGYDEVVVIDTKKYPTWQRISREERIGSGRLDKLNLVPIFELSNKNAPTNGWINIDNKIVDINDLVNFQIRAIDGTNPSDNKWMVFRAYLTQLSDNVDATWNNTKYAGRGEDFYIYNGFTRKINIGFKVAALSAEEMKPMYQKLNYLMSNLMPDYNNNLMRGPLVKMTVGNWVNGQDGILNSLSYTVPQESPWEVNITSVPGNNMVLPHIVEVQMTFTPIGSQTNGVNRPSQKYFTISNIAQAADDESNTPKYITGSISNVKVSETGPAESSPGSTLISDPIYIKTVPPLIGRQGDFGTYVLNNNIRMN
jgi:hypothetical protein